jgi:ATP-dependent Clp protease ATP-binding subunit ClpB
MDLELSEAALDMLGEAGFDPVYGARPLRRAIQNGIENRLAQEILSAHFQPGDTILVDKSGDHLVFNKKEAVNASAA